MSQHLLGSGNDRSLAARRAAIAVGATQSSHRLDVIPPPPKRKDGDEPEETGIYESEDDEEGSGAQEQSGLPVISHGMRAFVRSSTIIKH